ncbi:chloroplast precursor [Chlorella sorokiniana]|uniref:Chloroplast n=1 Tax=Chlorella sorokiniana TaxID=3076 RepID=A0A2P6TSN3_CHLSO|nr:chloroplast precursor [Chlorella sorokiniana]|eukprot:PRW57069.1 chloroplast precursor [Chlorella sorokiniana]
MQACAALLPAAVAPRPGRAGASRRPAGTLVVCQAQEVKRGALGVELGPIGLTIGKDVHLDESEQQQNGGSSGNGGSPPGGDPKKGGKPRKEGAAQVANSVMDKAGVSLGPIGLTVGSELQNLSLDEEEGSGAAPRPQSYASLSTEEWRALYEKDGCVDLWVEEEFNSGSRLIGGSAVYRGGVAGYLSGEGPGLETAQRHKVRITNNYTNEEFEVEVPEDRYILWAAEDEGYELPYACRLGCCTACTVKVKEGEVYQPHSLGLSKNLRDEGYALMCVSLPLTDCVLETVPEDDAYMLQFGRQFDELATDPNAPSVERDDFAIELAMLDE